MQNITKRNGEVVPYGKNKIVGALKKALEACEYDVKDRVIEEIANEVSLWEDISVEARPVRGTSHGLWM